MTQTPQDSRQADQALVQLALEGGRAQITVRSHKSGQHVRVTIVARKKGPDGRWVARNTKAGRVGMKDATCLEARDPQREYPDNYVGRLYLDSGEWKAGRDADPLRAWTAEKVIAFGVGRFDLAAQADVFLATECVCCGRKLEDPVSIERMIGPECFGKRTGSKAAPHQESLQDVISRNRREVHDQVMAEAKAARAQALLDPEPEMALEEARMHAMEAAGDLAGTLRDEAGKLYARGEISAEQRDIVEAEAEKIVRGAEASAYGPPCMGCGAPEGTHVPGECVR